MPISQNSNLKVGPTTSEGCLSSDFKSSHPLSSKSRVDTPLCDFEVKNDMCSPSFAYTFALETSTSLDTSKDVLIIRNPSLPLAPLGEFEERDEFETDASSDNQCGAFVK